MDLMEGDLSKFSWGTSFTKRQEGRRSRRYSKNIIHFSYNAYYCLVKHSRTYPRGAIIQFDYGCQEYVQEEWQRWFYEKDDFLNYLYKNKKRNKKVPLYARTEYAMIVSRYKWIKQKHKCYVDYGTIVMMLTGQRIGHVFKVYLSCPFGVISEFPFMENYFPKIDHLPQYTEIQKIINYIKSKKIKLYSRKAADIFVEKMVQTFGDKL